MCPNKRSATSACIVPEASGRGKKRMKTLVKVLMRHDDDRYNEKFTADTTPGHPRPVAGIKKQRVFQGVDPAIGLEDWTCLGDGREIHQTWRKPAPPRWCLDPPDELTHEQPACLPRERGLETGFHEYAARESDWGAREPDSTPGNSRRPVSEPTFANVMASIAHDVGRSTQETAAKHKQFVQLVVSLDEKQQATTAAKAKVKEADNRAQDAADYLQFTRERLRESTENMKHKSHIDVVAHIHRRCLEDLVAISEMPKEARAEADRARSAYDCAEADRVKTWKDLEHAQQLYRTAREKREALKKEAAIVRKRVADLMAASTKIVQRATKRNRPTYAKDEWCSPEDDEPKNAPAQTLRRAKRKKRRPDARMSLLVTAGLTIDMDDLLC